MEAEDVQFASARDFLAELKKEFEEGNNELAKVTELKKIEQERKIIGKFVQEFRRTVRESEYEGRKLAKKFKREMNRIIKRKLMEVERLFKSIEQQYEHATNLDRHWRKKNREKKRKVEGKDRN